jgi:hypothetical protein
MPDLKIDCAKNIQKPDFDAQHWPLVKTSRSRLENEVLLDIEAPSLCTVQDGNVLEE